MTRGAEAAEADAEAGSDEDEIKEFKYRGKTVRVDAGTYDVLEGLRREARGTNGRIGSELARTKERLARMEGMLASRSAGDGGGAADADLEKLRPDPLLATRDIAAWQAQYDTFRDAKEARRLEQLEAKYREDVAGQTRQREEAARTQAWADRFYSTYDHFDDPLLKKVVTDAYLDHQAEIDAYGAEGIDEAHARLAELADERLVRLKKAGKAADDQTPNDNRRRLPTFESSARATPRQREEKPDESRRNFSASSWSARERLRISGKEPRKER